MPRKSRTASFKSRSFAGVSPVDMGFSYHVLDPVVEVLF